MAKIPRRRFLKQGGVASVAFAAGPLLSRAARAQGMAATATRLVIDPSRRVSTLDRHILGSFLEQLGPVKIEEVPK